jgi:hypothetical protein
MLEFLDRYGVPAGADGPPRLVREVLGAEPDEWQEAALRAFGRGERRLSLRSCHGPGKTTLAAWLIWVMLLTRYPQKSIATAPTKGQIAGALFPEVRKWGLRLPPALRDLYEIKTASITLKANPAESFFEARTSRAEKPEALQGVHSENVLLVADEASGVPESIFEAAVGSMSGHNACTLLLGNPVRTSGLFFDTHHKLKDMWCTFWVGHWPDAATRPAGAYHSDRVSEDFAIDVARRYGEEANAYRVRVLGEFPRSDLDTIIPFEMVVAAQGRDVKPNPFVPEVWGLDIARQGDDLCVLCRRKGKVVLELESWRSNDLMVTAGRVKNRWNETPPSDRPSVILVDSVGLGAGVADRLRELNLPITDINVSEQASANERYRNLRTELWFKGREWLSKKNCKLPSPTREQDCPYERLGNELVVLKYTFMSSGKLAAEPKQDVKKRGYPSPNHADAFLLTLAEDDAVLVHGSEQSTSRTPWNEPLTMDRKGIV